MSRKGHATGKHISRSHTTVIGFAEDMAKMLDNGGLVTKVSLAKIDGNCGCKVRKLIISFDQFNLRLTVQEPPAKQELYVSAPDRDAVVKNLEEWCQKNHIEYTIRR